MFLFYLVIPVFLAVTAFYSVLSVVVMAFDPSGNLYGTLFRQWARITLCLFRIKITVRGTKHLKPSTTYIYLANHASVLDIPVIVAAVPDSLRFILKQELTKIPIWGWALYVSPHIIIRRTDARNAMAGIERAAKDIASGASVVIFPEGTRSRDGNLGPFKRGGFLLATKSGVPLVPVAIHGTWQLLPRTDWRVRPGSVEVIIGHPIENPPGQSRQDERAIQEETRRQLEEAMRVGEIGDL